jgi:uncharacterized protein involved in exopolysaccharide biosynthesis
MNQPIYEPAGQGPDVATSLRRQWKTIVGSAIIGLLLALALVTVSRGEYQARATLQILPLKGEGTPGGGRERTVNVETQATVARASELLEIVATRLDLDPRVVRKGTEAVPAPTGDVLYLFFKSDNAEKAAEGAKAYAEEYLKLRSEGALASIADTRVILDDQIKLLQSDLAELGTEIADLNIRAVDDPAAEAELAAAEQRQELAQNQLAQANQSISALRTTVNPGRLLVKPTVPKARTGTSPKLALVGGLLAGSLIGAFLALIRDRRDDRLGSAWRPDLLGVHELGRVELVTPSSLEKMPQDHTVRGEYTRLLLRFASMSRQPGRLVTSVMVTTVDVSPSAVTALGNVLDGLNGQGLFNGSQVAVVDIEAVPIDSAPASGTRWQQLGRSIETACVASDLVLVKVPPIGRSADGLGIATKVDHIVLLVTESTPVADVVSTMDEFRTLGGSIAGVVVIAAGNRGRAAAIRTPALELPSRSSRRVALEPAPEDPRVRVAAYLSNRAAVGTSSLSNNELTESQRALEAVLQRLEYQSQVPRISSRMTENWIADEPVHTNGSSNGISRPDNTPNQTPNHQ